MKRIPQQLVAKLEKRIQSNSLRQLGSSRLPIDFSSNDYIGFSKSEAIFNETHDYLQHHQWYQNGATGSRLISGNHPVYTAVEKEIAAFHQTESALIFNSGYDANVGFLELTTVLSVTRRLRVATTWRII